MRSRRSFVEVLATAAVGLLAGPGRLAARTPPRPDRLRAPGGGHPEPRPGIDASKIPPAEALEEWPRAVELFDRIREIPAIVDGIACQCGCRDAPGHYSFLSCFEGDEPMARWCPGCLRLGRFVTDLADEGMSLDDIRAAVDEHFGPEGRARR